MVRRPRAGDPEEFRKRIVESLSAFAEELRSDDLRAKVLALVPAFHLLRDLGRSLAPNEAGEAARDRILSYFRNYPLTVVHGDELLVVSGIQDWPRRLRELRVEFGWPIVSGVKFREMLAQGDVPEEQPEFANMRPEE